MARRKGGRSLSRGIGSRTERRTICVFTEGRLTEPQYITALKSLPGVRDRTSLKIEIVSEHAVPHRLVKLAAQKADEPEVDEVWCVFDIDDHPNLEEARRIAERHGVKVVVSNPCFELWLILHHQDQTASLTTADAERLAQALPGVRDKSIDGAAFVARRREATDRALRLDERHARNGRGSPHDNPSSGFPALLDAIEDSAGKS
ncbi:RloB domain-containing protein [Microbacterium bovistercoris]|uniref:RloB domain-containing protein n=1 Tax=Microbacterium bovistercoris TaxID=2293570 RepID=A0A371NYS9_9MICO|nr:RloB family protein [Microbacterium bovistercoris]REJ08067.1 RloB domain-containing protein [Microbacterium bovistercoris]